MNFITRAYFVKLGSQWCEKYRNVVPGMLLLNYSHEWSFPDSLKLGSPRLLSIWATPCSPVCWSLRWECKAENPTSPHSETKFTSLSSYFWMWFTCTNYLLECIIRKRNAQPICKQIYMCLLPLISHLMNAPQEVVFLVNILIRSTDVEANTLLRDWTLWSS